MTLYYSEPGIKVFNDDCLELLRKLPDNSIDSIVTDPPYGLSNTDPKHVTEAIAHWVTDDREWAPPVKGGFMGKTWDSFVPPPAVWDECYRVLKPGGHLLSFAGTRTIGLMEISIRLAQFDIRESIAWMHGQGFPKSMNVSKAIDRAAGATREVVGQATNGVKGLDAMNLAQGKRDKMYQEAETYDVTVSATDEAKQWEGWGTALKPAFEPIIMARKPLSEKTVAANVLAHGTGALNIDATRIGTEARVNPSAGNKPGGASLQMSAHGMPEGVASRESVGRWPTNVILDEGQAAALDEQSGMSKSTTGKPRGAANPGEGWGMTATGAEYSDEGGASRFFYVAKDSEPESPAFEPIIMARKPLSEKTVAANVLKHGTGALNIDATRVGTDSVTINTFDNGAKPFGGAVDEPYTSRESVGRWPANVILDEGQAEALNFQAPLTGASGRASGPSLEGDTEATVAYGARGGTTEPAPFYADKGGAARFFYVAKAPKRERPVVDGVAHSTVKPLSLMQQLVKLVTPPNGVVLDPFAGSGTTVEAAILEGFKVVGIEKEESYLPLIKHRIERNK